MENLQFHIDEMNRLLRELIDVATRLRNLSLQVFSEESLVPLQKNQEEIIVQLEKIDQLLHDSFRNQVDRATQENFHQQLQVFQQLNHEFIQNLKTSPGIIQFEFRQLKDLEESEDLPPMSRPNKIIKAKLKTLESNEE